MRHTKEIIHFIIITSAVGKQRTAYSTTSSLRPMVTELHDGNTIRPVSTHNLPSSVIFNSMLVEYDTLYTWELSQ